MSPTPSRPLRVRSMTRLTPRVMSLVFESLDRSPLPPAAPGDHMDLRLGPGLSRSYSIVGQNGAPDRYEVAVALDAQSRGGSRQVHERLRVGDVIEVTGPRNLFALHPGATHSLLIAGGIGITPLWSMAQALEQRLSPWTLCFAARNRQEAAYLEDIEALVQGSSVGRLLTHFDDEAGRPLDLHALLAQTPRESHLYCCGPAPMLAAYEQASADWPAEQVHLERFAPLAPQGAASDEALPQFEVVLARSGHTLQVAAHQSILDVLLDHGINAPYGCMQGVCGMCEVPVLDGIPDHRDQILSEEVKQQQASVIVCCSRSRTPRLTLDL